MFVSTIAIIFLCAYSFFLPHSKHSLGQIKARIAGEEPLYYYLYLNRKSKWEAFSLANLASLQSASGAHELVNSTLSLLTAATALKKVCLKNKGSFEMRNRLEH